MVGGAVAHPAAKPEPDSYSRRYTILEKIQAFGVLH